MVSDFLYIFALSVNLHYYKPNIYKTNELWLTDLS